MPFAWPRNGPSYRRATVIVGHVTAGTRALGTLSPPCRSKGTEAMVTTWKTKDMGRIRRRLVWIPDERAVTLCAAVSEANFQKNSLVHVAPECTTACYRRQEETSWFDMI